MSSFISKVVSDILNKHKRYNNLQFILPSQRACVFLKEELLSTISDATFLPKINSIENFIQEIADVKLIDNTQLLFEFYSVYKEIIPQKNLEEFSAFSQWGTTVLHDFNEVDSYLINANQLFNNLRDVKRLNKWFQDKKPSELATKHLQFFEYLSKIYEVLYQKLVANKYGYQGLIYKEAVNNLEFYIQNNLDKHLVFVGFNALNKAEEKLVQELLQVQIATIYWDADESFFNTSNEAGSFMRKYKREWNYYKSNPFLWIDKHSFSDKNVEIIGVPKNISQIKYVGELLSAKKKFTKTALVLADENLLNITLNSLPNNVDKINITMGYPLKDVPLTNLFQTIFKLHLNQEKLGKNNTEEFYFKDVLDLLSDSYLNKKYEKQLTLLRYKINTQNSIFIKGLWFEKVLSENDFEEALPVITIFKPIKDIYQFIELSKNLITVLKSHVSGLEKEYLYRFYQIFQQLETLNKTYGFITDLKTFYQFFNQLLKVEKLSFKGEPLEGLQLMGMLETRTLDFDTVIITSVNEGILPVNKNDFSFIPFDIKKYFGLPTYQEKDAIFSYHFQRLLLRAKNSYLLYNTETDGYGAGEKSRFLTQLEIKYPFIKNRLVSPKVELLSSDSIVVKKTEKILKKLKKLSIKGISPSAIASYIYNPIQFYEQKILAIYDTDSVDETIALNTMGTVIHETLKDLYLPFLGSYLLENDVKNMEKNIDSLLQKYFKKEYKKGTVKTGKNKLIYEVSKSYLKLFLKKELALLQKGNTLKILAIEKELATEILIDKIDYPIKIKGIADRIDQLNDTIRIVDYKTGKVVSSDLKLTDFAAIKDNYKYTKAMQVMLYSFLFKSNFTDNKLTIQSGIISFKNLNAGFLKTNFALGKGKDYEITSERINDFMDEIKSLILEILNPEIPFTENLNLPF